MFVAEELQCKKYIKLWFTTQWPNDIKRVAQNLFGAGENATNPGEKLRFYSENLLFYQNKIKKVSAKIDTAQRFLCCLDFCRLLCTFL